MNDTQTQIDRLIELAIVQRTELKQLVEQLPQLREHLNAEVERTIEEVEPQLRAELEDWTTKQTIDQTAKLGVALEAKITELSKALEVSTQARYNAIIAERAKSANLAEQAEAKIAEHAAKLPSAVKEIVSAELSRFPRAGEIDQLRKEFAEPRGLNPRGKWSPDETYNRLDLVAYNGDSYVSNRDGNAERPSRTSAEWTLSAARGAGGGGGGITSLNDVLNAPTSGQIIGSENGQYVPKTLAAGANITITETANTITIIGDEGQISLSDGTAGAPSLHFTSDTDTGVYRPGANTLGISVSGTQIAYFDEDGLTIPNAGVVAGGSFHAANGNANNPSHSFTSDQDTGFFHHATNQIGVSTNGVASLIFTQNAGELLGHTGVSVTFGAGSSGATIALGQGTNGGVTITPKGSGTAVVNGTTIPASKTLVVTTDKLSALAATSSSELAGVISDETGTGSLVFANTPTLITPNIGAATGTSVNLSGAGTFGGNLTVSGTSGITATDLILGSSGPSAKSSIAARAARQGLVFDGTNGATFTGFILGSSDFTAAAWVKIAAQPAASQINDILGSTGGSAFALRINTYGGFFFDVASTYSAGTNLVDATPYIGKTILVTYSRSASGTTYFYINGVSVASRTDTTNYSGTTNTVGTNAWTGNIVPLIYNRALSAAEVVALYEAGVPAGSDYNNAGQTISNATWTNGSSPFSSFSSASGAAVSGTSSGFATAGSTIAAVSAGKRVRVSLSLTLTSGQAPQVYLATNANQGPGTALSNAVTLTAGSNVVELVSTNSTAASLNIAVTAATNFSISSVAVVGSGLLLAPDAAQAGGGLTWYDTSGNAANITLPASGVSWNVPTSSKTATGWTFGGKASVNLGSTSGTAGSFLSGNNSNYLDISLGRAAAEHYIGVAAATGNYVSGSAAGDFVLLGANGSNMLFGIGGTERARITSTGNYLVGTTTDGGQKLQVSGTALITATSDNLSIRGIAGGTARGFDLRQSGDTEARVLIRGDSRIFFGNGSGTFDCYVERNSTNLILGSGSATALTLDSSQNATFAGSYVRVSNSGASASPGFQLSNGSYGFGHRITNSTDLQFFRDINSPTAWLTVTGTTGNVTFAGTVAIGNTVNTVSPTSPNRTITMVIGGTTYYLHAKTTND